MSHGVRKLSMIMVLTLILVVWLVGCGKAGPADEAGEDAGSSAWSPLPGPEGDLPVGAGGQEAEKGEGSGQEEVAEQAEETEREPTDHPAAFNPQLVRAGDRIAGLEVKDIRTGEKPYEYVIVELDGQLQVTGTYTQVNDTWIFRPDASERELLPHVEGQRVRHYIEDEMVPRITNLHFRGMQQYGVEPANIRVGRATVVLENYKVQYVPDANWNNVDLVQRDNVSYLDLGDEVIEFGLRYVDDTAKLVRIIGDQRYHELEPGVLKSAGADARPGSIGVWEGLDISLDLLAAWDGENGADTNYGYLIGNHVNQLQMEEITLPGIGEALLFIVERDKWDDAINFYNGYEYEYWIVVLREVPDVRLEGDEYRYAFCLIGYSDELILGAEEWMKQLAAHWRVPPEDFYM